MLTMIHANPIFIEDGHLIVDRKFHAGMQNYCEAIAAPVCTVNHTDAGARHAMDAIRIPLAELSYTVLPVEKQKGNAVAGPSLETLRRQIEKSTLVYGMDFGSGRLARAAGKPYIAVLEYDLGTRLKILHTETPGMLRRNYRSARCIADYYDTMRLLRRSREVHCNGYPIFYATRNWAPRQLLYLDSRITAQDVISRGALDERLKQRPSRRLRLIYSGRYEPMKGALDAVKVALQCLVRGLDIEFHSYGQGSLASAMRRLAGEAAPGRINIHDVIPFQDLMRRSREADLFVCCHVQSDPSCTYLEAMGCGLPVVGYANRMWTGLQAESGAGLIAPINATDAIVSHIAALAAEPARLDALSGKARDFALAHTFEQEFRKRTDAINAALAGGH